MPKRLIPSIPEEESFEQTLVPERPVQQETYEREQEPEVDETELEDDEEDEPVYVKSAKKQPKKGKRKPSIWTVLLIIIAIALVGILGYIGYKAYDYYHVPAYETGEISDDEEEPEETPPPAVPESEPTTTEDEPEATPKPPYSQNLIGYLTVPGVDVTEEPVLQHSTDDNFYLTHNEWDRESIWGAYYVPSEWDVSSVDDLYRVTIATMHNPNEMRPVIHRLDRKSVPQNIQDLRVGAMGFQSGMFYIYKGQVGLLANNYMEKGWRKQDYAAIIRPENYCKLLPQCFVCSGKDDFLKAQTKQFVKLLNADGRHFQYVFSDAKGADHAYAALHPETEWGEMANDDMLAFFDRCKR